MFRFIFFFRTLTHLLPLILLPDPFQLSILSLHLIFEGVKSGWATVLLLDCPFNFNFTAFFLSFFWLYFFGTAFLLILNLNWTFQELRVKCQCFISRVERVQRWRNVSILANNYVLSCWNNFCHVIPFGLLVRIFINVPFFFVGFQNYFRPGQHMFPNSIFIDKWSYSLMKKSYFKIGTIKFL